jgi:hypothetical protein
MQVSNRTQSRGHQNTMGKHWKILGMSLLALVGVLAINASAAQAKWLILVGATSPKTISLKGTANGGFLLSANGNEIHCNGSSGNATISLSASDTVASGTATVTFTGCTEEQFKETCGVHSAGKANGTIVASGEAVAAMTGETVYAKATSKNFTTIEFSGEECPLAENVESVSGSARFTVTDNALTLKTSHTIALTGENLKLGESNATLENNTGGAEIAGQIEEAEGKTFAVHLCALPGAPVCP